MNARVLSFIFFPRSAFDLARSEFTKRQAPGKMHRTLAFRTLGRSIARLRQYVIAKRRLSLISIISRSRYCRRSRQLLCLEVIGVTQSSGKTPHFSRDSAPTRTSCTAPWPRTSPSSVLQCACMNVYVRAWRACVRAYSLGDISATRITRLWECGCP